jgi:Nif-specific regulatory protein
MKEDKINIEETIRGKVKEISDKFMEFSKNLDSGNQKKFNSLFIKFLEFTQFIDRELTEVTEATKLCENNYARLKTEKERLETLYTSGILFVSETELHQLLQTAINTIIKELNADKGFVVLVDAQGETTKIVSKDMDYEHDDSAKDLSSSIIKETMKALKPVQLNDLKDEKDFMFKSSVKSLGLSSALCVPLLSNNLVLGSVYVDRREREIPFTENDLSFLVSFGKQIAKGIEISLEITQLGDALVKESKENFLELRNKFIASEIIGQSKKLFNVLKIASQVAGTDASILLCGENGTGKDLLAQAIHNNSNRAEQPFVAINCGAIPHDLLESELFGYEQGAFTGASSSKPGRLETADGGTVFLDEIAELNINLQAKLLRVIQTKEIERLGSVKSKIINVRFVTATNKSLKEMIQNNLFREDLYYRLKVIEIRLPSLRERREDIEELSRHFLAKYSKENKFIITPEAMEVLYFYDWPGNVRELENVIQRCVILSKESIIRLEDLPQEIIENIPEEAKIDNSLSLFDAENQFRRLFIQRVLRNNPSKSEAAKILGINRTHFYKLLAQLGIDF